jgi:hypothetical protein
VLLLPAGFTFFALDLEWVIPGWLRGEAFYQGRPTSYWRCELGRWSEQFGYCRSNSPRLYTCVRKPLFWRDCLDDVLVRLNKNHVCVNSLRVPPLHDGDPAALPVLEDLYNPRFSEQWRPEIEAKADIPQEVLEELMLQHLVARGLRAIHARRGINSRRRVAVQSVTRSVGRVIACRCGLVMISRA